MNQDSLVLAVDQGSGSTKALLVSARRSRAAAERRLRAVSRAGRLAGWTRVTGRPGEAD